MANKSIKKHVLDRFNDQVIEDYQKVFEGNATIENFCYYLIKRGIIPTERARNYAIVRDYQKYVLDTSGTKTDFCFTMESDYKLSEKQIQNILSSYIPKFFLEKHIDYSI
ncbi:hypothetical protein [uncultured Mediterranean phage uvDeep-CGR2-KM21-C345]|nr:hypothetical protein [uncultured Mediterranean phage uvDeep-CGR2-KM21-C345]